MHPPLHSDKILRLIRGFLEGVSAEDLQKTFLLSEGEYFEIIQQYTSVRRKAEKAYSPVYSSSSFLFRLQRWARGMEKECPMEWAPQVEFRR